MGFLAPLHYFHIYLVWVKAQWIPHALYMTTSSIVCMSVPTEPVCVRLGSAKIQFIDRCEDLVVVGPYPTSRQLGVFRWTGRELVPHARLQLRARHTVRDAIIAVGFSAPNQIGVLFARGHLEQLSADGSRHRDVGKYFMKHHPIKSARFVRFALHVNVRAAEPHEVYKLNDLFEPLTDCSNKHVCFPKRVLPVPTTSTERIPVLRIPSTPRIKTVACYCTHADACVVVTIGLTGHATLRAVFVNPPP